MSWSDVYLFCFLVGVTLSVFSFLAGVIHLHVPLKLHLHLHLPHPHGASHGGGPHISWFNASTVLAFLAWFGGVGYLMTRYSHVETFFVVAIATLAGMAAGWVVLKFLVKLVGPSDEPLRESDRRVIGALGTVSMTIRENGTGEIIFPLGGGRSCSGARSEDGRPIEKGTEVVIERYEKGIAYVKRWEEFVKS
ncbi:MAG TPA: NfeD family protein [Candidatus Acidoferrum sp.]|jgi:asparagine N-glycosylation enzyme membrane subunit Stt3|nr:NfeD family protein [Candidatus Acidoferrum sp.]